MKRAPKVLISFVLLLSMLVNVFPIASIVTQTKAAYDGYTYKPVTSITPGKEYLILSTNAVGTAYALAPANGAENGNLTTSASASVTINNDGTISGSESLKDLEWEFIQSAPRTADGRAEILYMLQNISTGAYLWNPAYEVEAENFGTCITPMQDAYNGATMAVFDFNAAGYTTDLASSENLFVGANGTATFEGPWLKMQSPATGDGYFTVNFERGSISANTWKFMQYTYHTTGSNGWWNTGKPIGIYTNTSDCPGPSASYYYGGVKTAAGWQSPSMDLYNSVANSGYRGIVKNIRIDPVDAGDTNQFGYVDSVILGKTVEGIQTVATYRNNVANARGAGLMPSVEYPFCQFAASHKPGNGFELAFFGTNANNSKCLAGPSKGGDAFRKLSSGNVFLYEKTYDAGTSEEWILSDEFENGVDFVIANVNDGVVKLFNNDGTTVSATVSNGKIISEIPMSATWSAYENSVINGDISVKGQKGYWLSNNLTRIFLITNGATLYTDYLHSSAIGGWYGANICNNIWNYENGKLISSSVNKAQIAGENDACVKSVTFADDKLTTSANGSVYIFKKVYHESLP